MMSDSQDSFEKDPAGWTQVGLAISAFSLAIMAFGDASKLTVQCLASALICSVIFTVFQCLDYSLGYRHRLNSYFLILSVISLSIGTILFSSSYWLLRQ